MAEYVPYWQKLQDPRWQRKRLEIMERAGWKCELCWESTETLNVHHKHYRKGADPWDYENDELRCLCKSCHEQTTLLLSEISGILGELDVPKLEKMLIAIRAKAEGRLVGWQCHSEEQAEQWKAKIDGLLKAADGED